MGSLEDEVGHFVSGAQVDGAGLDVERVAAVWTNPFASLDENKNISKDESTPRTIAAKNYAKLVPGFNKPRAFGVPMNSERMVGGGITQR